MGTKAKRIVIAAILALTAAGAATGAILEHGSGSGPQTVVAGTWHWE
jgi:hypothetical protein